MLPIPELVRFGETLDDAWRSPLADAAGRRWGVQRPVFVRSSASHVLVADTGSGRRLVLRMRPHTPAAVAVLARGAHMADAWHRAGAPFVAPAASVAGRLVERVGGYVVTALHVADVRAWTRRHSTVRLLSPGERRSPGCTLPVPGRWR